jgi:hypothetical protein
MGSAKCDRNGKQRLTRLLMELHQQRAKVTPDSALLLSIAPPMTAKPRRHCHQSTMCFAIRHEYIQQGSSRFFQRKALRLEEYSEYRWL